MRVGRAGGQASALTSKVAISIGDDDNDEHVRHERTEGAHHANADAAVVMHATPFLFCAGEHLSTADRWVAPSSEQTREERRLERARKQRQDTTAWLAATSAQAQLSGHCQNKDFACYTLHTWGVLCMWGWGPIYGGPAGHKDMLVNGPWDPCNVHAPEHGVNAETDSAQQQRLQF